MRLIMLCLLGCADPDARDSADGKNDVDGDGYYAADDCDDKDPDINPGAVEICDDLDNDCDGDVDGGDDDVADEVTWYRDADGDGFGIPGETEEQCNRPDGYSANADDCDDGAANIHPDVVWYLDADDDRYGVTGTTQAACYRPDGFAADEGDCNDADPTVYPTATEVCDGVDNDCDNETDDADPSLEPFTWYADEDEDGYGYDGVSVEACEAPPGYVATSGDCDDGDAVRNPEAVEYCDGLDNDCDGEFDGGDDSVADAGTWYADTDEDGFGDPDSDKRSCDEPSGYVDNASDCDDGDDNIHPDGDEVCDSEDNDCDGLLDDEDDSLTDGWWYVDEDGDSFGVDTSLVQSCSDVEGYSLVDGDCDDADEDVNPDASESFDGADTDCDGETDVLSAIDAGASLVGERAGDEAAKSLAGAGDINGDGYADLIIGAPAEDSGGSSAGAVYVMLGPVSGAVDLSLYRSKFIGDYASDAVGTSVAGGADLDGDGTPDVVIGAPEAGGDGTDGGAVWIMSGDESGPDSVSTGLASISAESMADEAGFAVAITGDLYGDGFADLIIGARGEDSGGGQAGAAYLVSGATSGSWRLSLADKLIGEAAGDYAGSAVAGGGDVDGDGVSDHLIGAPGEDSGGSGAGAAYVVLGLPSAPMDLAYADYKLQGEAANDGAGTTVAWGGDLDGDGFADVVVGAPAEDSGGGDAGAVYLVSGAGLSSLGLELAMAKLTGDSGDAAGTSLAAAGDLNVDGFADLAVGIPDADDSSSRAGAVSILLGPVSGAVSLMDADARLQGGAANDLLGTSLAGVGDVNGDGIDDLLAGAPEEDSGGASAGLAWLLYGAGF